ncbi:MAG: hypothetical protein OK454_01990 [Thaumarchaeota archaeon]|nr:hypothetical protein [Nitrososphaerota archaeon]
MNQMPPDDEPIPEMIEVIRKQHGCEATWIESVHVHEDDRKGGTAWEGDVQVFDAKGHPRAKRVYGWSFVNDDSRKRLFTVVLGDGPVTSALMAVRVYLVGLTKGIGKAQ